MARKNYTDAADPADAAGVGAMHFASFVETYSELAAPDFSNGPPPSAASRTGGGCSTQESPPCSPRRRVPSWGWPWSPPR